MKKLIYCALALAAGLFATSCMQENLEPVQEGNTVTFTVEIPEVATKATIGDEASSINDLVYAVYRTTASDLETTLTDWDRYTSLVYQKNPSTQVFTDHFSTTVSLELINNQNYVILFWAQKSDVWVSGDNFDLTNITYPADSEGNMVVNRNDADKYAAFSAVRFLGANEFAGQKTVELKRPFAQINIAAKDPVNYDVVVNSSSMTVGSAGDMFNVASQAAAATKNITYTWENIPATDGYIAGGVTYDHYVAMGYVFAKDNVSVSYAINTADHGTVTNSINHVPVAANYRTNIVGSLLTSNVDYEVTLDKEWYSEYIIADGETSVKVMNNAEFTEAFDNENMDVIVLGADINLNDLMTRAAADPTFTVAAAKTLTIDLGGHKLSATSAQSGKSYDMFLVKGNLTVKNGTIEYEHKGENMGWGSMTCIFDVTAGGVLNLEGVTAKNLGGSDMGFVAHLNNWGEVTLNAENCTLESNYVPVRVFNSGYDMNNVTIKNSTLKGGSAAFWVHNYTVEDFGSAEKAEAQKALLNLSIYNQGNTFSPDVNGVRYGFTNSVRTDAYGITKTVSEDGTVVTLGSVVENGVVRRGVAGTEGNTTITKIIVGEGISELPNRTFYRYKALETVELPSTLKILGSAGNHDTNGNVFQGCSALKNIVIPESVTTIGPGVFYGCSSLKSINIPTGVTRIEEHALRETGLMKIEFHEGVTYFGNMAFRDCEDLTEVIIKAPYFEVGSSTFLNAAGAVPSLTIYVANSEMKAYLEPKISSNKQFKVVVPGLVNTADEFKAALADSTQDIITLAAGVTFEGVFDINRGVEIVSESADNKATIKGRVNVNSNSIGSLSFTNVHFATNAESSKVWTGNVGSDMKSKPSIIMAQANGAAITFSGCDFDITTSVFGYTNTSNTYTTFDQCTFNGAFNYAMYVRANIEVTNCTYNTTVTNVLVGACVNNLENGKVVFMNNNLPNGANIGLTGAIVFCSTNNDANKKWSGPVEFTVKDNTGFAYAYERMGDFVVDPNDHTFTEGSATFSF